MFELPVITRKEARARGLSMYFTGVECAAGHVAPRFSATSRCVICNRVADRERVQARYAAAPDEFRRYRRRLQAEDPVGELLRSARGRAKLRGIKFTIGREHIRIDENCPCCGREMVVREEPGRFRHDAPSLDRFYPSLGYVPGNVNVICWRCNDVKRTATSDELRAVLRWMEVVELTNAAGNVVKIRVGEK